VATSGAEDRPAEPRLGRRTKRAECQTLAAGVATIAGHYGPESALDAELELGRRESMASKMTLSPQQKWQQPGLTRKSSYQA
jgi:hypothetical protein